MLILAGMYMVESICDGGGKAKYYGSSPVCFGRYKVENLV